MISESNGVFHGKVNCRSDIKTLEGCISVIFFSHLNKMYFQRTSCWRKKKYESFFIFFLTLHNLAKYCNCVEKTHMFTDLCFKNFLPRKNSVFLKDIHTNMWVLLICNIKKNKKKKRISLKRFCFVRVAEIFIHKEKSMRLSSA